MDIYDQATEKELQDTARAIEAARSKHPTLTASGECHNCAEPLPKDQQSHLFCDCDCRDDWQRRNSVI